jgi:hypothetical protein
MHPSDSNQNPYSAPEIGHASDVGTRSQAAHPSERVNGPAIGIMVTSIIGIVLAALGLIMNLLGVGLGAAGAMGAMEPGAGMEELGVAMGQGLFGVLQSVAGLIVGAVCLVGAQKMRNLERYHLALTSSVLIMVPCLSPCCVLGLPFGIWSLIVLNDPFVKSAFQS